MRLIISKDQPIDDSWVHISNMSLLDVFVDNAEAKEIVIDFFLGDFYFGELENVIGAICQKLRVGGRITIHDVDFDFIVNKMENDSIETINYLIFDGKPLKSFYTIEYISSLLSKHVKIVNSFFDDNNNFVLVGERC